MHVFIDQLLSLDKCKLAEPVSEFGTLVENPISIRLCDTDGKNYYLGSASKSGGREEQEEERKEGEAVKPIQVPVTVIFN